MSIIIKEPKTDYERCIILARSMAFIILQCHKDGKYEEAEKALGKQKEYLNCR
jgi:hypothetical protein